MYFLFVPWAWVFVNCLDFFVILGRLQSGVRFMKLAANVNFSIPADIFLICQTLLKYNLISIVLQLNCKGLSYYLVGISWYVSCRGVHGTARDAMRRWRRLPQTDLAPLAAGCAPPSPRWPRLSLSTTVSYLIRPMAATYACVACCRWVRAACGRTCM